jgi:hypothetical protein
MCHALEVRACRGGAFRATRADTKDARELPNLSLEETLKLVYLYAERDSPKFEKAALRRLARYLAEGSPGLQHFAEVTASLAKLEALDR